MNIYDPIYFWGKVAPNNPALAYPGGTISYRQLCIAADNAAREILRVGFKSGDLVTVSVVNPVFQMIVLMALGRVNINSVFQKAAGDATTHGLPVAGAISENRGDGRAQGKTLTVDHNWFVEKLSADRAPRLDTVLFAPNDIVRIVTSSGTSGKVKYIALSRQMLEGRFMSSPLLPRNKRVLNLMMPTSSWGLLIILNILRSGGTYCFAPFPDEALGLCEQFRVENICVSVQQAANLVDEQIKYTRGLSSVEQILVGGSIVAPQLIDNIRRYICRDIVIGYGATEGGQIATGPINLLNDIEGAVGFIHPGVIVEIVDQEDRSQRQGDPGIIRISGPGTASGYLGEQSDGDGVFSKGWFYPGDRGHMTNGGMLVIEGRESDLVLNHGGQKVSTAQVEERIKAATKVADVAVVAGTSSTGAPEIWAAVVPAGSFDAKALKALCDDTMGVLCPDRFFSMDVIPRNEIGKIQYKAVRDKLRTI